MTFLRIAHLTAGLIGSLGLVVAAGAQVGRTPATPSGDVFSSSSCETQYQATVNQIEAQRRARLTGHPSAQQIEAANQDTRNADQKATKDLYNCLAQAAPQPNRQNSPTSPLGSNGGGGTSAGLPSSPLSGTVKKDQSIPPGNSGPLTYPNPTAIPAPGSSSTTPPKTGSVSATPPQRGGRPSPPSKTTNTNASPGGTLVGSVSVPTGQKTIPVDTINIRLPAAQHQQKEEALNNEPVSHPSNSFWFEKVSGVLYQDQKGSRFVINQLTDRFGRTRSVNIEVSLKTQK